MCEPQPFLKNRSARRGTVRSFGRRSTFVRRARGSSRTHCLALRDPSRPMAERAEENAASEPEPACTSAACSDNPLAALGHSIGNMWWAVVHSGGLGCGRGGTAATRRRRSDTGRRAGRPYGRRLIPGLQEPHQRERHHRQPRPGAPPPGTRALQGDAAGEPAVRTPFSGEGSPPAFYPSPCAAGGEAATMPVLSYALASWARVLLRERKSQPGLTGRERLTWLARETSWPGLHFIRSADSPAQPPVLQDVRHTRRLSSQHPEGSAGRGR